MELVNESGLEAAWVVSRMEPPAFAVTVVVKGTFELRPDEPVVLAEKQLPLTGDKFEAGDPAKPLRYPFDFAPFKPRADVLLVGTCHAPRGRAAEVVNVGLRVGAMSKSLFVHGDRSWRSASELTHPRPFVALPLTWEHAYGGPGFDRNPLGKGAKPIKQPDGSTLHALSNIESPGKAIRKSTDHGEPAGFGPIPDTWPQRLNKFGTIHGRYVKERWPWYPHNFDWGFFNTAPEDQQVEGFLKGDEEFAAENLHSTISTYRGRLPGLRARSFLNEQVRAKEQLREIPMQLDTLWLDMDTQKLVLVWRGHLPVRTEKLLEVMHLFVLAEPLSQKRQTDQEYRLALFDALAKREAEDEELEEEEEPEEEAEEPEELEEEEAEEPEEVEPEEAAEEAPPPAPPPEEKAAGETEEAADEEAEPEEVEPEEPEEPEDVEEDEEPPDEEDVLTVDRVKEMIGQRLSFEGCDLTGLTLSDLDFSGLNLREAILERAVLVGANLSNADLSGAVLACANLREAKCMGTNFAEADLTEAWLVQADLSGADLTGADLTKAQLRRATLRDVKAPEAVFVEADLSEANLEGADLRAADLCVTRLHRTILTNADLSDAALEKAWGRQVQAPGAILNKLRAARAVMIQADFRGARGDESVWEAADLFAANFSRATLNRAEFSTAYLGEANFDGATVKEARFEEASLRRAHLVRCNLLETSFGKANLTEADLTEANLFGATLMDAIVEKTNFKGANLRRIKNRQEIT
jgi:uncharacterized protein YjbI with pentapeptide repeats